MLTLCFDIHGDTLVTGNRDGTGTAISAQRLAVI